MPQAGIDPPAQSHASYDASALPPKPPQLDFINCLLLFGLSWMCSMGFRENSEIQINEYINVH